MRKGTCFLKRLVSKNWVLHETLSNQNKFRNIDKQECKPYQICILLARNFQKGCTAKSRPSINSCHKFSSFLRYFYIKKWKLCIFFFLLKGKRHVWMTNIEIIVKFRKVLSRFEEKKNVINIPSVKNSFKFLWALFKPFLRG